MAKLCGKCKRKRRFFTRLLKVKGKKYWIDTCVECKTPMSMEGKDKEDEASA